MNLSRALFRRRKFCQMHPSLFGYFKATHEGLHPWQKRIQLAKAMAKRIGMEAAFKP